MKCLYFFSHVACDLADKTRTHQTGRRQRLSSWLSGKNLPVNAGDVGSVPDLGRSPMPWNSEAHVSQLLSLCSRAQETQLLKPAQPRAYALQQEKPLQQEARGHL